MATVRVTGDHRKLLALEGPISCERRLRALALVNGGEHDDMYARGVHRHPGGVLLVFVGSTRAHLRLCRVHLRVFDEKSLQVESVGFQRPRHLCLSIGPLCWMGPAACAVPVPGNQRCQAED